MKIRKFAYVLLLCLIVLTVTACAKPATPTQPGGASTDAVQACLSKTSTSSVAEVQALIQDKLMDHHNINEIYNIQHTRDEWNATLDRMIGYGAVISDSEKTLIIDYLLCRQQ